MNTPFRSRLGLLILGMVLISASVGLAESLVAPQDLRVQKRDGKFVGRWTAVKGASHYEVWVQRFGRWSFNEKRLETTPFTSSFELPVDDERARFKVRAVDADGAKSAFSSEVRARAVKSQESPSSTTTSNETSGGIKSDFDPKAPPPPPPTGLFAIWIEPDVIKLVWRHVEAAKNYAVEENREGKWVSIPSIEFPKVNNALIKAHPAPGPYHFRVRSVGKNGRASKPSRTTRAKR